MAFSSVEDLLSRSNPVDQRDRSLLEAQYIPDTGEYLSAAAGQAFDRTFGVRVYEEADIWWQEQNAPGLAYYKDEDEYKNSEHYRKEIPYEEGMSNVRARMLAEDYDERRQRERIIAQGDENGPWWYGMAGFGAGLVGSLPDPINLIPFGGGAVTGTKLAGMTTKQVLASSAKTGIIEGAAGNLVSSGFAAWDLNRKGENLTTQDVLVDTMFGAVAGPLFHGGGAFLSRAKARGGMRADINLLVDSLPEESALRGEFSEMLQSMKSGDAASYKQAGDFIEILGGRDTVNLLRQLSMPEERMEVARAMEKALADVLDDGTADVGVVAETIQMSRALDRVQAEVDARTPAGNAGEVLVVIEPIGSESMGVQRGPMAEVDGEMRAAGRRAERQTGSRAGYGLTKVLIEHPEVTRADVLSIPRIMREYEPDTSHGAGRTWVVERKDGKKLIIGETVTKEGGMLATVHIWDESPTKRIPEVSKKKSPEKSANPRFAAVSSDTAGVPFSQRSRSPRGDKSILIREGEDVNAAIEKASGNSPPDGDSGSNAQVGPRNVDWRVEPEQNMPPLPEKAELAAADAETTITDANAVTPEEAQAAALVETGKARESDIAELAAIAEERTTIDRMDSAALQIAECVMGVI
ncbi:hypothetical protein LJC46_04220 [Desulfovibrio sp. OttesenSCG-928-G15]|nr:hypothetical protein [Desulfovibrio sp. OttesenSCG-928-G15]